VGEGIIKWGDARMTFFMKRNLRYYFSRLVLKKRKNPTKKFYIARSTFLLFLKIDIFISAFKSTDIQQVQREGFIL